MNDGITITLLNKTYFLPRTETYIEGYYVFDKGGFLTTATNVVDSISSIDAQLVKEKNVFKIDTKKRNTITYGGAKNYVITYENFRQTKYQMTPQMLIDTLEESLDQVNGYLKTDIPLSVEVEYYNLQGKLEDMIRVSQGVASATYVPESIQAYLEQNRTQVVNRHERKGVAVFN